MNNKENSTLQTEVKEIISDLKDLTQQEIVAIHNACMDEKKFPEHYIYSLDETFLNGYGCFKAVSMASRSDCFHIMHNFVRVNNLWDTFETCDYPGCDDDWIDYDELVTFLLTTDTGREMAAKYGIETENKEV